MDVNIIQTLLAGLLGGSVIGFIEFMIKRKDEKNDKNKEVLNAVEKLDRKLDDRFDVLDAKIDEVDRKYDERSTVSARIRILRFADEMMEGRKHSKDSWDQCLTDCDTYEDYCEAYPSFKNNQTETTISYLKKNYLERLERHDFL